MKTHNDLIYAPIGSSGPHIASARLEFTPYRTTASRAAYRIRIDGLEVGIYYLELKSNVYHKRYAIEPVSVGLIGWNVAAERRACFEPFLRKYQIDYDSVSVIIPVI